MSPLGSYGTLAETGDGTLEFTVDGRIERAWKLGPPITSMPGLVHSCLISLANDGWRPISHVSGPRGSIVLARVPYTAGSKLSLYGTLRHLEDGAVVLTVAGAALHRWDVCHDPEAAMNQAIEELEREGWRLHRRYRSGATVVRG